MASIEEQPSCHFMEDQDEYAKPREDIYEGEEDISGEDEDLLRDRKQKDILGDISLNHTGFK
jgi:hypothetical protein